MAQVQSNDVTLKSAVETALGTAGTTWHDRFYGPGTLRATPAINQVAASHVSKNRNRQKGETVGVRSTLVYGCDLHYEPLRDFGPALFFTAYNNEKIYRPTAVVDGATPGYTIPDANQLAEYPAGTLVLARGFADDANNGLKVVGATSSDTLIHIPSGGLVADAAVADTENATVEVCGVQAAANDLSISAAGHLTSVALDFTTLGLTVGQRIKIGGDTAATQFTNAVNNGTARITAISATQLTLDRRSGTFVTEAGAGGDTIQLFFGPFLRNVGKDDPDFLERSYAFEIGYENLQNPDGTGDAYRYPEGHELNRMTINLAAEAKATMELEFVGLDNPSPTTVRATGADSPRRVVAKRLYNCSSDVMALVIAETDETVIGTYVETASLAIENAISQKMAIGSEGAVLLTRGDFGVTIPMRVILSHSELPAAVRDKTTLGGWWVIANADGGFAVDVPSLTVGDGTEDMPENDVVSINVVGMAHEDPTLGYSVSLSLFPYFPGA